MNRLGGISLLNVLSPSFSLRGGKGCSYSLLTSSSPHKKDPSHLSLPCSSSQPHRNHPTTSVARGTHPLLTWRTLLLLLTTGPLPSLVSEGISNPSFFSKRWTPAQLLTKGPTLFSSPSERREGGKEEGLTENTRRPPPCVSEKKP